MDEVKTLQEKAAEGRRLYGSARNEAFTFNGEKWKFEDGVLYQFRDNRWIYKSEESSLERAKRVAETQSFAFAGGK